MNKFHFLVTNKVRVFAIGSNKSIMGLLISFVRHAFGVHVALLGNVPFFLILFALKRTSRTAGVNLLDESIHEIFETAI